MEYVYGYLIIGLIFCFLGEVLLWLIDKAKVDGTLDKLAEELDDTPLGVEMVQMSLEHGRSLIYPLMLIAWLPLLGIVFVAHNTNNK
ncbi:MAG: hypothetical protein DRI46_11305 [Chloroflexi bacterium]|nr:MAG: hypothetical protein DRI46_11305 [Chloroflexota bacterium]